MKRIPILLAATALMTLPAMTLPAMAEQAATTSSSQIQLAQMQKGSTDLKKSEKDKPPAGEPRRPKAGQSHRCGFNRTKREA